MLRLWSILYCISYITVCTVALKTLQIALHAQLYPSEDKVVGSVITTNGLKTALQNRHDVSDVDIFYPTRYDGFLNRTWDMILIEGWFPSITNFLRLARNNFPHSCIVFICLDPTYPGLEVVKSFAVDGIITNSVSLVEYFAHDFMTEYMMLAADPVIMKPERNISREWGAVYVGAGGHMLQVKPELRELLLQALPYRLRLHGSNWEIVPEFKEVSLGTLPQMELASAYSSAHTVLASTIQSQSIYGMVNNRIFEALSCGAVVISWFSTELQELHCDALLLINQTYSLQDHMNKLLDNTTYTEELHRSAREFILRKHTWAHRAVPIIDYYHFISNNVRNFQSNVINNLQITYKYHICGSIQCKTGNCPTLLWLVSPELLEHSDYIFVGQSIASLHLCSVFNITILDSIKAFSHEYKDELSQFDVILAFITPFDQLDLRMRSLDRVSKADTTFPTAASHLQKHVCYIIGYNPAYVMDYINSEILVDAVDTAGIEWQHYDAVWYRSSLEIEMLGQLGIQLPSAGRWQQMFGIGAASTVEEDIRQDSTEVNKSKTAAQRVVVVCWIQHVHQCSADNRSRMVNIVYNEYLKAQVSTDSTGQSIMQDSSRDGSEGEEIPPEYILLLLGGQWNDWLNTEVNKGGNGEPVLQYSDLHRVIHVRTGWTGDAGSVVQAAEVVVVMNPPDSLQEAGDVLSSCDHPPTDSSDDTERFPSSVHHMLRVLQCQRSIQSTTSEDIFWPYIAAAVSNTRIHLLYTNRHILYLLAHPTVASVDAWDREFFKEYMIKVGTNRLLGLGSRHSKFSVRTLTPRKSDDNPSDTDSEFYHSFQSSHEFYRDSHKNKASDAVQILFLELNYENFEVGRDGEACIEQQHARVLRAQTEESRNPSLFNLPGDRICLMRPYRYLVLQSYFDNYDNCIHTETQDINSTSSGSISTTGGSILTFFLRGSFFGDPFYSFDINLQNILNNNIVNTYVNIPVQWNMTWLTKHSVFIYNMLIC